MTRVSSKLALTSGRDSNEHKNIKKSLNGNLGKSVLSFYYKNSFVYFIHFKLRRTGVGDGWKFVHGYWSSCFLLHIILIMSLM